MRIIVDDKIPYIEKAVRQIAGEVVFAPGKAFTPALIKGADALVVRTRTRCGRALLAGSGVRFIATATIGFDHIDTAYCREAGIAWTNAPGCNAASVVQYVQSALILLQQERGVKLKGATMGIVGAGHVGSGVARMAREMGLSVLLNDTLRADREGNMGFVSLEEMAARCDIVSFHVPLNNDGIYKTFHLAGHAFFQSLKRCPVLINTSRGEVVDTAALTAALDKGRVSEAVIDVWEREPDIDRSLLYKVFIGTPHIAGYSADGKANATRMVLDALCRHFHLQASYSIVPPAPPQPVISAASLEAAYLKIYNPLRDDVALKAHPELFEQLRGAYPLRREPQAYTITIE
ncbi:MAG: 4-phosphoerythronate dehydrogenase PdxB [Prevotellaceae bacterium]|nr:4-phosphoerythronate dehydrogenase PdxB [Prevotellaceae bacterium]